MKIVIVGAGAMGSLYGAKLALGGHDVTMIDVVPVVVEAIQKNGIVMDIQDKTYYAPAKALFGKDLKETPDLLILFTKTMYSETALEAIKQAIGDDTIVLSVQNGLGNIELIQKYVAPQNVIVGTTIFDSDAVAPGHIRTSSGGHMSIMYADGQHRSFIDELCDMFNAANLSCEIAGDVLTAIWEKVAFNSATNTMAAVTRLPDGCTLGTPETLSLAIHIAKEVTDVANACGVKASFESVKAKLENSLAEHAAHFPSMAQDVFKQRKTEIFSINGAVVERAKAHGMEVPYTETMYLLVRTIEQNYGKQKLD